MLFQLEYRSDILQTSLFMSLCETQPSGAWLTRVINFNVSYGQVMTSHCLKLLPMFMCLGILLFTFQTGVKE